MMHAHQPAHTTGEREAGKTGRRTPAAPAKAPTRLGPGSLAGLQGAVGNAAVVRMVQRAAPETHRHGAGCGHQEEVDVQRAAAEEGVQRAAVHDVLSGSGKPLDQPTRTEMEGRLGADFSDVRVHTGRAAQDSASQMGARAYTSGSHIVIGKGGGDRHTLAHELTHVIQQRNGPVSGTDTGHGYSVSDPSDRFERAAEANARKVMSGPAPGVQRQTGEGVGDSGASRPASDAPVQRKLETVTKEPATVSHYAPTKEGADVLTGLTIERPKVVTGSIDPTSTKGRPAAPDPLAVISLHEAYVRAAQKGAPKPQKADVWRDLFGGAGYDRGHVMGLEVGGEDRSDNIVPQWSLNQGTGAWRDIEHRLVGLKKGKLEFHVSYATNSGNHRQVMIPVQIDVWLDGAVYEQWDNGPDPNDLIRAGADPSDASEYYLAAKAALQGKTTLDESEMQNFALWALSADKASFMALADYEDKTAQGKAPGSSSADAHQAGMSKSDIPKKRRDGLIKEYVKRGWVSKKGSGDKAVYTLGDVPLDSSSDSESSSQDGSQQTDVSMADASSASQRQHLMSMTFDSQDNSSDPDYSPSHSDDDAMSTGS
ncbi:eCIS core domain-containing protein [Streptomyces griseoluteus]|uniref:eCIS core domain-containing protein n=1 Tax=Streptomyces griseoluteus TaxID=29306 RepID=UPI00370067FD